MPPGSRGCHNSASASRLQAPGCTLAERNVFVCLFCFVFLECSCIVDCGAILSNTIPDPERCATHWLAKSPSFEHMVTVGVPDAAYPLKHPLFSSKGDIFYRDHNVHSRSTLTFNFSPQQPLHTFGSPSTNYMPAGSWPQRFSRRW